MTGSTEHTEADSALVVLFQHKTWATAMLIEACRELSEEQLSATTPGTFGSIHSTLQHLVSSDEGYFNTLTGIRHSEKLGDDLVSLKELAERVRRLGPHWEALARDAAAHGEEVTTRDGWRTPRVIPLNQAIHHADDHRSQVLTIIGGHGLELPGIDIGQDFDVWHYGISTGLMQETEPDVVT